MRCSDFAFARFRFLRRVLLVHGHWYYWRVSTLVQYFFYKNITFITPAVFFSIFSAYSTQVCSYISCFPFLMHDYNFFLLKFVKPVYDTFFLTFYNIFFTSWPILIFGLLEQNFTSRQLLDNLHLYRDNANNARMSWLQFFKWIFLGLLKFFSHLDTFQISKDTFFSRLQDCGTLLLSSLAVYYFGLQTPLLFLVVKHWTTGALEH